MIWFPYDGDYGDDNKKVRLSKYSGMVHVQEEEWSKDVDSDETAAKLGGRTPLHIVAARPSNSEVSKFVLLTSCT